MKYNNFKDFFWKEALFRVGFPWGFFTGLLVIIIQDPEIRAHFLSAESLITIIVFTVIGGFLMAWSVGKALWKRSQKHLENNPVD